MAYGGFNIKQMDAAAELGKNPVSKHQIQPEYGDEQADAGRDCRTRLTKTKSSGANGDREELIIFPVQLTTNRIGSFITRLILTLAIMTTVYIHTYTYYIISRHAGTPK